MSSTGQAGAGEPFERTLRRHARARAAGLRQGRDFLLRHASEGLHEREVTLPPLPDGPVLQLGALAPVPASMRPTLVADACRAALVGHRLAVQCDEDRLPFRDRSFALVRSALVLHGVNDVPGALALTRRALMDDGWFLGVLLGGFALAAVRRAFIDADLAGGGGIAIRIGPSIDPAEAAGLLQRAGFRDPVVEVETVTARYRNLADVARDARAMGETGWLAARSRRPTTAARWAEAEQAFARQREDDGKVPVSAQLVYLSARR
jgi:NADH dehydrogenase [ubiquinone] 1 alpha subcomplex assembly factor 5